MVNVLYTLSETLGEGISLVFSPGKVIFAGVGVLLLVCIVLNLLRSQYNGQNYLDSWDCNKGDQGRLIEKRLIGRTDMEDALQRLDKLTQEEARMALAENMKATHTVDERVREVTNTVVAIDNRVASLDNRVAMGTHAIDESVKGVREQVLAIDDRVAGVDERVAEVIHGKGNKASCRSTKKNQLQDNIYNWLSPPDPSTNHNIACDTHYKKAVTWFFQGSIFCKWKSTSSLLWIHGK
ncbi:hypothetical protein DFH94DRAFT_848962, partial [Russula ochroleuca]